MKKSMKNRVAGAAAVLLAGSMAFSMTGCGSSSDNTAGQQTTTDQKTEGNEEYTKIVYAFKSFNSCTIFLPVSSNNGNFVILSIYYTSLSSRCIIHNAPSSTVKMAFLLPVPVISSNISLPCFSIACACACAVLLIALI